MVICAFWHLHDNPLIYCWVARVFQGLIQKFFLGIRHSAIIFNPNYFVFIPWNSLVFQIFQNVEAFSAVPIKKDKTNLRIFTFTILVYDFYDLILFTNLQRQLIFKYYLVELLFEIYINISKAYYS